MDRHGYANPCRCQLCQALGGNPRNVSKSNYLGLDEEEWNKRSDALKSEGRITPRNILDAIVVGRYGGYLHNTRT